MKEILIIDDDAAIVESLQFLLEDAGYKVSTSDSGDILDSVLGGKRPDLILMDYWLPNENGGILTRKLKNNNKTKNIPVIMISASYNIKDFVAECGADDFIPKPYDMIALLSKVEKYTT